MPDNAQVQVNLGDVLLRLGQSENAVACYRRALELEPNNEQVRAKLKAMASYPSN
jgi:Flp pilus assembly protein TadD